MLFKWLKYIIFYNDRILNDAECTLNLRYDKILLAPGVYDEQIEISSKIPFEIVGEGELGQVSLWTISTFWQRSFWQTLLHVLSIYTASFSKRLVKDSNLALCCIISR